MPGEGWNLEGCDYVLRLGRWALKARWDSDGWCYTISVQGTRVITSARSWPTAQDAQAACEACAVELAAELKMGVV